MINQNSKFYSKSLTLLVPILEMLAEGQIAAEITRKLNLSEPLLSYYITKAKSKGYIQTTLRDTIKIYELTQPGKKFLERYQKYTNGFSLCRGEKIAFKAEIHSIPSNLVDWKKVGMNNWSLYTSEIDGIQVKLNLGKHPTVEFLPSPVDGDGAIDLAVKLTQEVQKAADRLEDRTGLKIGQLKLEPSEWVVYSPIAKWFSDTYGQVRVKELGKVNASKPRRLGEFEFHDLRDLADFMLMPRRIEKINAGLEIITADYERIKSNLERVESSLQGLVFGTKLGNSLVPIRGFPLISGYN